MNKITSISIAGFKSIKNLDRLELNSGMNILIGPNGSGKTSFLHTFTMLDHFHRGLLAQYNAKRGGLKEVFSHPSKRIKVIIERGENIYENSVSLHGDKFSVDKNEIIPTWGAFNTDAQILTELLYTMFSEFHHLYKDVVGAVRLISPSFDDFDFYQREIGKIGIRWRQKGVDEPMPINYISHGTVAFILLATSLLYPDLPSTMIFDEPEGCLHPYAIAMLAELMQSAAQKTQLIVATQSPTLINYFGASDLIVTTLKNGYSNFERVDEKSISSWLENYTLGELWVKGVIGQ